MRAFDRRQQRHPWLALPVAVVKKFSDDQAGSLAALIAYYAFFSIFPLLLVFVTILGFVLEGHPHTQHSIANSVLGQFPVIGDQITHHALRGRALSLIIGILASLWAGLGVTQAAQNAFDQVWAVPRKHRGDFINKRLRGFVLVLSLGLLFVVTSTISGLVIGGLGGAATKVGGIVLSFLLNLGMFAAAFRLLTAATVPTKCLSTGVVVGAVLWQLLQVAGGFYVNHVIRHATSTYGLFATVIGLLAWLHLGAQATLYAAEINVVLARRLWPRSLFSPETPEDERTLEAIAKAEERSPAEKIDVRFEH